MERGNRVKDTSTTTGTGDFTMAGTPAASYQAFSVLNVNSKQFAYFIDGGAEWEVGIGLMTSATTFSRTPVFSSNLNSLVNFSAGTKTVIESMDAASMMRLERVVQVAYSATPAINSDTTAIAVISAMSGPITSLSTNLTGTQYDGQTLEVHYKDNGTARALAPGPKFIDGSVTQPTTTVAGVRLRVYYQWDALLATPAFVCVGKT